MSVNGVHMLIDMPATGTVRIMLRKCWNVSAAAFIALSLGCTQIQELTVWEMVDSRHRIHATSNLPEIVYHLKGLYSHDHDAAQNTRS